MSFYPSTEESADRRQNLTSSYSGHGQSLHKISSKSVYIYIFQQSSWPK